MTEMWRFVLKIKLLINGKKKMERKQLCFTQTHEIIGHLSVSAKKKSMSSAKFTTEQENPTNQRDPWRLLCVWQQQESADPVKDVFVGLIFLLWSNWPN